MFVDGVDLLAQLVQLLLRLAAESFELVLVDRVVDDPLRLDDPLPPGLTNTFGEGFVVERCDGIAGEFFGRVWYVLARPTG